MFNRKIGTISKKIHTPYEGMFGGGGTHTYIKEVTGNGYINLTNAVAHKLLELKAYGGTEQRNLPSGYTQLEYIKSSGTQYIDTGINQNTLVKPRIITKYKIYTSEDKDWFGGSNDDGGGIIWDIAPNTTRIAYIRWKTQTTRVITFESGYSESDLVFLSDFHTLDVGGVEESGDVPIIVDNNLIGNINSTTTLNWVNHNLLIFRSSRIGQNGTCSFSYFTIYSNGVKVWDGVACRRNSDNELGMYDLVSGQFFTNAGTGTFTAGATAVPTPATPMDIVSNNGVLKLSPNLFDKNSTLANNRIWAPNFSQQDLNDYYGTNIIKVIGGHTYTRSGEHGGANYFKLSDNTYTQTSDASATITVPNNAVEWVFNNKTTTDRDTMMVVEGNSLPQEYVPYGQIYTDGTTETVSIKDGNNILPANAQADILYPVDIPNSDTYIVSADINNGQQVSATEIRYYDDNKSYFDYWTLSEYQDGRMYKKITLSSSVKYVSISKKPNFASTPVSQIKLEKGEVMTPYYNGGTATAEMLLKVGDYQDVQSIIDGGVTRNIGVKVLDGTENIGKSGVYAGSFFVRSVVSDWGTSNNAQVYCSHFSGVTEDADYAQNKCMVLNNAFNMWWTSDSTSTAAQFKQWLAEQYAAGTPVIVIYSLATPTTETVTGQSMDIQAGTNTIEITQASIDNLPLYAKYNSTSA